MFFFPKHRNLDYSGYASSIYLGCFVTSILKEIKFNEKEALLSEDSLIINDFLENPFIGTGAYENTESSILLVLSVGGLMLLLPLTLLIINSLGKIIQKFFKSKGDFFTENHDLSFISIVFIYFLLLSITEGFLVLDRFSFNSIIIIYCLNRYISFLAEKNINQSGLNIK